MESILNGYIEKLKSAGAGSANIIKRLDDTHKAKLLNSLDRVVVPDALEVLLSYEYDSDLCDEYDYCDPEFAWGMHLMDIDAIQFTYDEVSGINGENDTYFPLGFLPILADGAGSYVVVNCLIHSPTYGAVYDMCDGVGVNMIARDLPHFFDGLTKELDNQLKTFEDPEISESIDHADWFYEMTKIFGNTPYFSRKGKMDTQIIDWI